MNSLKASSGIDRPGLACANLRSIYSRVSLEIGDLMAVGAVLIIMIGMLQFSPRCNVHPSSPNLALAPLSFVPSLSARKLAKVWACWLCSELRSRRAIFVVAPRCSTIINFQLRLRISFCSNTPHGAYETRICKHIKHNVLNGPFPFAALAQLTFRRSSRLYRSMLLSSQISDN